MAQRRMFSPEIVESEEFLSMPPSAQNLYFHLGMNGDDDGFIQPQKIMRQLGSVSDDLKVLLAKRFLLNLEDGVMVIKHWLIHNMIRADRYKPTRFQEQKKMLYIKDNNAYTDNPDNGIPLLATKWQPNGNQMAPQVRLGKVRLGKKKKSENKNFPPVRVSLIGKKTNKKGEPLTSIPADGYSPDWWSPKKEMEMRKRLEKNLGIKKTNQWSQLLFGTAWDFLKAFEKYQGYKYPDNVLVEEVSKTLAKWYELGETRETIREMLIAFFEGKKANVITITPNSVFSSHTFNSWKQNKL